jgi:hypothetical protein
MRQGYSVIQLKRIIYSSVALFFWYGNLWCRFVAFGEFHRQRQFISVVKWPELQNYNKRKLTFCTRWQCIHLLTLTFCIWMKLLEARPLHFICHASFSILIKLTLCSNSRRNLAQKEWRVLRFAVSLMQYGWLECSRVEAVFGETVDCLSKSNITVWKSITFVLNSVLYTKYRYFCILSRL